MGIDVTYSCDRCKAVVKELGDLWRVEGRTANLALIQQYNSNPDKKAEALWCRPCVESVGWLPQHDVKVAVSVPPPTLEEIIREIVRETVREEDRAS